jgi:hypothetical protein
MQMEQQFPEIHCRSLYTDKQKPWRFELLQDVRVQLSNGCWLIIPAGYITDFASVPRIFRGIVQPGGNHNLATLIHDWLYDTQLGTRKQADEEMLHWLMKAGCSKAKAYTMYLAVRIGGRSWWKKDSKPKLKP